MNPSDEDYPGRTAKELLPKHIGGYQHLEPEVIIQVGDILVCNGAVQGFATPFYGEPVGRAEAESGWRIYRLMPVAKQSDSHERDVKAGRIAAPLVDTRSHATLPSDAKARKGTPIYSGFIKYFPLAIAEVARVSQAGNDQHNPGKPLHWDRSKSGDELDAASRHLVEAGSFDSDGQRHSAKLAWRAMANLQKELEGERK